MFRLTPKGKWGKEEFISCGKLLRWRANVLEHQCPKCKCWSIRWADCIESNYCSHCGKRMTKEDSENG